MNFSQPLFLLFLLSVPLLIYLYMIKPRYKRIIIPSTFLWERLKKQKKLSSPAQKMRFSVLLLLGILVLIGLSVYLSGPCVLIKNFTKDVVFVFDNSASMCAKEDSKSYLEKSKIIANEIIDRLPGSVKISIVTFSDKAEVLQKEANRALAKKAVEKVFQTYYPAEIKNSFKLIQRIFNSIDTIFYIFTDKDVPYIQNAKVYKFPKPKVNVSIENISCISKKDGFDAMVVVKNRGDVKASFELELFADRKLVGLKNASLLPGKEANFVFENIKGNYKLVMGKINFQDAVKEDNVFWNVLEPPKSKCKVLYVGKGNFFVEKLWLSFEDVEFYKTYELKNSYEDFDIYIFDKYIPQNLPQKGGFVFFLPSSFENQKSLGIKIGKDTKNEGFAKFVKSSLTQNIEGFEFAVQDAIELTDKSFEKVALLNDKAIISYGSIQNHPAVLFGFSLDNSDLPLKVSFPVLMANIKNALVKKNQIFEKTYFYPGDDIKVYSYLSSKAYLFLPGGKREAVDLSGYPAQLPKKDILGVYSLVLDGKSKINYKFAINYPAYVQDFAQGQSLSQTSNIISHAKEDNFKVPYSLRDILLILVIVFLTIEWMVFLNGNRV